MPDSDRVVHFTTDGKHFGYEHDVGASSGLWRPVSPGHVFRPVGMTWEAAKEAVCAATAATPPPPQQPKAEEPFRPGLPPAELRAVCKEWEWCDPMFGRVRPARFQGDEHILTDENAGPYRQQSYDHFRPLGRTWADVETAVKAAKTTTAQLPKDGDIITVASAVAIVKEGCRQALDEAATRRQPGKVGNYAHVNYTPRRTFIIASPSGRRKYVKLLLKRLGYRNVDKIPTTDKQTPYDLGRSLPDHERDNLLAIAPGIVLRDVL
jgi:broad specificity phosphatase PhoE